MFEIEILVEACEMTGLEALDWRRSHDMFDGVKIKIDSYRRSFPVDEAFARRWFLRSETSPTVTVNASDLLACDVETSRNYDWIARVRLNPERAKALFVAARRKVHETEYVDVLDFKVMPSTPFTPGKVTIPPRTHEERWLSSHPRCQPDTISPVDHALEQGGPS